MAIKLGVEVSISGGAAKDWGEWGGTDISLFDTTPNLSGSFIQMKNWQRWYRKLTFQLSRALKMWPESLYLSYSNQTHFPWRKGWTFEIICHLLLTCQGYFRAPSELIYSELFWNWSICQSFIVQCTHSLAGFGALPFLFAEIKGVESMNQFKQSDSNQSVWRSKGANEPQFCCKKDNFAISTSGVWHTVCTS